MSYLKCLSAPVTEGDTGFRWRDKEICAMAKAIHLTITQAYKNMLNTGFFSKLYLKEMQNYISDIFLK
jgi:hypothetical protein